jgi:hypothetical protein
MWGLPVFRQVNTIPPPPVIEQSGGFLISNSPSGNQWVYQGSDIPGAVSRDYLPQFTGDYWDYLTRDGCISDTSNHIYVVITGTEILPDAFNAEIFPVPNDGRFKVMNAGHGKEPVIVKVYNCLGIKIFESSPVALSSHAEYIVDLGSVNEGIYSVVLQTQSLRIVKKIMVLR